MTTKQKIIRVAAYIRVSTKMQVKYGVSLAEQRKDIIAYCERMGYELIEIYEDQGISGARRYRPEFVRMLDDIKARKYDVVIAWRIDRLTRSGAVGYRLRDALDEANTELECAAENMTRQMFGLLVWLAEREREDRIVRGRMGARGKASNGEVTGVMKYGYRLENKKPVPDEKEAPIVQRIFADYISGKGAQAVANALQDDGIPTRKGGYWWATRVWDIIKDPIYIGKGVYGRRRYIWKDTGRSEHRHTLWLDKDEAERQNAPHIEIPYPPLVDTATFEKAQEVRKHQRRTPRESTEQAELHAPGHSLVRHLWG